MELNFQVFITVLPMVFLAAVVDSICGGGGLISGIAYTAKMLRPSIKIYGVQAANAVAGGECELGIVICGTGIGMSLAANKVKGIRCALCSDPYSAKMTRAHNNANMLALGARVIGVELAKMIVDAFLDTAFEGGRHQTRVDMLTAIENGETIVG